jgi:hypothetical protein
LEDAFHGIIAQLQKEADILHRAFATKLVDMFLKTFGITAVKVQPFHAFGKGLLANRTLKTPAVIPQVTLSAG